jgi:hypothetical protein
MSQPLRKYRHEPPSGTEHRFERADRLFLRGRAVPARPTSTRPGPRASRSGPSRRWFAFRDDHRPKVFRLQLQQFGSPIKRVIGRDRLVWSSIDTQRRPDTKCGNTRGSGGLVFVDAESPASVGPIVSLTEGLELLVGHRSLSRKLGSCSTSSIRIHGRRAGRNHRGRGHARLRHDGRGRVPLAGESRLHA